MKTITRREALPAIATVLTSATGIRADAATSDQVRDQNAFPVFSPDFKTLQKSMQLFAVRWWIVKYDGRTYHFCRENLPFVSVSRYDIHGWYKGVGDTDERLFHVWSARTYGIGEIRVDIDEAAGTVSVVALERKLKGKQIAFYALSAANP